MSTAYLANDVCSTYARRIGAATHVLRILKCTLTHTHKKCSTSAFEEYELRTYVLAYVLPTCDVPYVS